MARPEKVRIGDVLIQQNLITEDQLKEALAEQRRSNRKLGRVLVESGLVTEESISQAIARQMGLTYIDLKYYTLNPEFARKLPETQSRRFRAIVLGKTDDEYVVGMADPTDFFAYDEIERILRSHINVAVVTDELLAQTIDRVYQNTEAISSLVQELSDDIVDENAVDFGTLGGTPGVEEAPVVKLLQTMFEQAVKVRASDIHIEPQEKRLNIRFRIDGVLHMQTETDAKIAPTLVLRLKLVSGLDISEKRLPQDGRFVVNVRQKPVDVRISTLPTQYGESVVMRLLNPNSAILTLDQIGMPKEMLDRYRKIVHRSNGMILVTGPTGSGKTTTLYATLAELNSPGNKIITVEDPVEYRLAGVNQVQINEKIDLSFARVLRACLRQDPDIILVGEIRDQETAQIGLRAAITGHMVLSTLHTNDAMSSPIRLLDMGVPRFMVAMSIQAVLAQRLVRTICNGCKDHYELKPFEFEWIYSEFGEKTHEMKFYKGKGCTQCNGSGYQGRRAIYEMFEMTVPLIDAINHAEPTEFIQMARQQMMGRTLKSQGILAAAQGLTSIEEAIRISNQAAD